MPKYPQYLNCQCQLRKIAKLIPYITAIATCDIKKFTGYLFSDKYDDGKKKLFESWGFIYINFYGGGAFCYASLKVRLNLGYSHGVTGFFCFIVPFRRLEGDKKIPRRESDGEKV